MSIELIIVALIVNSVRSQNWQPSYNMTHPIAMSCAALIQTYAITAGGVSTCCPENSDAVTSLGIRELDMRSKFAWRTIGLLSEPVRGHATCARHGSMLAVTPAAQDANAKALASQIVSFVEIFSQDLPTAVTAAAPSLQFARRRAAIAATLSDWGFVIGGVDESGTHVMHVEGWPPENNTWINVAILPQPLCDCAVAPHTDHIYLLCSDCAEDGMQFQANFMQMNTINFSVTPAPVEWKAGPGRMISVDAASIAQYAIFMCIYEYDTNPYIYFYDVELQQLHLIKTSSLSEPRAYGTVYVFGTNLYFVGGQPFANLANTSDTELLPTLSRSVDSLPIMKRVSAEVESLSLSFTVGDPIPISCTEGEIYRLATTTHCGFNAAGSVDVLCEGGIANINTTRSSDVAYLCASRGSCLSPFNETRKECFNINNARFKDFLSCNQVAGCCWDSVSAMCFSYFMPSPNQTIYFVLANRGDVFSILDRIPGTSPPTSFVRSPPGIAILCSLGLLPFIILAVFIRMRHNRTKETSNNAEDASGFDSFSGRYIIVKKLGQGGFGQVFLVQRRVDGELFAMKYIPCSSDAERSNALKEFEVIRQAQGHPHMVTIYDMFMNWSHDVPSIEEPLVMNVGNDDPLISPKRRGQSPGFSSPLMDFSPKYVCIVMCYCSGGDLAHYILHTKRAGGFLEERWLLYTLARQVCQALSHLHNRPTPIVHRDLKPENVLVSENRKHLYLTDFGLAQQQDRTYLTTRAGSLHYVAPECWKKHYSSAVDMWAVGCILYGAATGRVTQSTARVMFNDAKEKGFAREIRRDLEKYSHEFSSFVLALLTTDPRRRLTAAAALQWLDDCERGVLRNSSKLDVASSQSSRPN